MPHVQHAFAVRLAGVLGAFIAVGGGAQLPRRRAAAAGGALARPTTPHPPIPPFITHVAPSSYTTESQPVGRPLRGV